MNFNEQKIKQYSPSQLTCFKYDDFQQALTSGNYNIDRTTYSRKTAGSYDNEQTLLSFWSIDVISVEKLMLILSMNPNKTKQIIRRRKCTMYPPLFHVSTFFCENNYVNRYIKSLHHIDMTCNKLRLILQDGYDFGYRDVISNNTLLQHYQKMVNHYDISIPGYHDFGYHCEKINKCIPCILKKLYNHLAKVTRECWLRQTTLFELMLQDQDFITTNKKQRKK